MRTIRFMLLLTLLATLLVGLVGCKDDGSAETESVTVPKNAKKDPSGDNGPSLPAGDSQGR